jgi:hypothetical protein
MHMHAVAVREFARGQLNCNRAEPLFPSLGSSSSIINVSIWQARAIPYVEATARTETN